EVSTSASTPLSLSRLLIDLAAATQSENEAGTWIRTFHGEPSGIAHQPFRRVMPAARSSAAALAGSYGYGLSSPSSSPSHSRAALAWMPEVVSAGVPPSGEATLVTWARSIR